jgi:minor extracellular protease Epr
LSHLSMAQQIGNSSILKPISPLKKQVLRLNQQIIPALRAKPFSLSELPKITDTVTQPLNTLAPELEIEAQNGNIIYKDVMVENGWRAIQRQWVVLADDDTVAALSKEGAKIVATKPFNALGLTLLHFIAPPGLDAKAALQQVLPPSSAKTLDRNHVFSAQAGSLDTSLSSSLGTTFKSAPACLKNVSIGMVDSNLDKQHQAFLHTAIVIENIVSTEVETPVRHGTAVASLLVGNGGPINALLPNGNLFLASVFHRQSDFAQGATTINIIKGLNWLASKDVTVINMSLAGPDNKILALAIEKLSQRHVIVVAAAGNEGPLAQPLYPAAYQQVIAVSATDHKQQIYRWSNRGEYIDFSALGVNVATAQPGNRFGLESGTSMASPVIAATIACQMQISLFNSDTIKQVLRSKAIDLGKVGKDPVFGYGLITPG